MDCGPEQVIPSSDTGQQMPHFDSCQLTLTRMAYITLRHNGIFCSIFVSAYVRPFTFNWFTWTDRLDSCRVTCNFWMYKLAFSLLTQINWDKRKCLHDKKFYFLQDYETPTWQPFYCLGTQRCVKTVDRYISRFYLWYSMGCLENKDL